MYMNYDIEYEDALDDSMLDTAPIDDDGYKLKVRRHNKFIHMKKKN